MVLVGSKVALGEVKTRRKRGPGRLKVASGRLKHGSKVALGEVKTRRKHGPGRLKSGFGGG